jgi:hypothetical protein
MPCSLSKWIAAEKAIARMLGSDYVAAPGRETALTLSLGPLMKRVARAMARVDVRRGGDDVFPEIQAI